MPGKGEPDLPGGGIPDFDHPFFIVDRQGLTIRPPGGSQGKAVLAGQLFDQCAGVPVPDDEVRGGDQFRNTEPSS